jgi:C1A family cysteine protease
MTFPPSSLYTVDKRLMRTGLNKVPDGCDSFKTGDFPEKNSTMYYSFNKLITMALAITLLAACQKDNSTDPNNPMPGDNLYPTGWNGLDENVGEVPMTSHFGFGTGNIPDKYDLTDYLPPIGDQGQYGTCVSWAVGYNVKTAISAIEKGLNSQALTDPTNQFSPKDLHYSIPDDDKNANCGGTSFKVALQQIQDRGIARMSTVPYTNLGNCSQNGLQSDWTQDAANNKIEYWRRIEASPESIKQNIAKNIPVIMGAKLADNFMSWNSDAVLTSNSSFDNVGIHSYHALAIVGYDDSKGPNGAFRVVNSWSERWGDTGFIWIDYNFLVNEFVVPFNGGKPLFIAANQEGEERTDPPNNDPPVTSGVDLAAWVFEDYSTAQTSGIPLKGELYSITTI